MTLRLPRRRFDDNGQSIVEWPAETPAEAIAYWRGIINATRPDGYPVHRPEVLALAERSLKALLEAKADGVR